jgi:hypothetical protein
MDPVDAERDLVEVASVAVLGALDGRWQFANSDLVEVGAQSVAHVTSSTAGVRERCAWTNWTAIAPSPTAVAQRLVDPERTSPAANTPGMSVSSRLTMFAAAPVRMKPLWSRGDGVVEPLDARERAEEEEHEREGEAFAARECDGVEVPVLTVERGDLASVADGDAMPLQP